MKKNTEVKVGDLYFYKRERDDQDDRLYLITKVSDGGDSGTGYWLVGKNTTFWGKLSLLNDNNYFKLVKRNNHTICERCNHE